MYKRRFLRDFRRSLRLFFGLALARLVGPGRYATTLRPDDLSTVLVCRINGRIGNTMFLTPMIHYLHARLPRASIDLVLAHPKAKDLLGELPGVRRIITFPHKTPRMIWRFFRAVHQMRACQYDLAIDPTLESTSGRIALTLCRARYRLGFATRSQWAPLTHAVPEPRGTDAMHQAARPVFLLSQVFGTAYDPEEVRLWLPLRDEEIADGRRLIARVSGGAPALAQPNVVSFFAHATGAKFIDQAWWAAFWEAFLALEPAAMPVEFLPSEKHPPTLERFRSLHVPSLRTLTAAISATRMFISTDTGPMHLGSSTAVPTVGLFQASAPVLFRPLKPTDLAIDISECTAATVAQRCQKIWRSSGSAPTDARQVKTYTGVASER